MIQINRAKNCYSLILGQHTSFGAKKLEPIDLTVGSRNNNLLMRILKWVFWVWVYEII